MNNLSFRIVVGFDFSPQSELALRRAVTLASRFPLTVIHVATSLHRSARNKHFPDVAPDQQGIEFVRQAIQTTADRVVGEIGPSSLELYAHARLGRPESVLLNVANEMLADMIMVGTHGKSGVERWILGSVSEFLVKNATCTVSVVRTADYETGRDHAFLSEPQCSVCLRFRRETNGDRWYCSEHDTPTRPAEKPRHIHYERDASSVAERS